MVVSRNCYQILTALHFLRYCFVDCAIRSELPSQLALAFTGARKTDLNQPMAEIEFLNNNTRCSCFK